MRIVSLNTSSPVVGDKVKAKPRVQLEKKTEVTTLPRERLELSGAPVAEVKETPLQEKKPVQQENAKPVPAVLDF